MSTKIAVFGDMTPRGCKLGEHIVTVLDSAWRPQNWGTLAETCVCVGGGGFPEVSRLIVTARTSGHYVAYRPKTFVAWAGVGTLCFYSTVDFSIASRVSYTCWKTRRISTCILTASGVACWPLVPKFAGSNPAEAVGFLRTKNPQHAFLRRGSKAVCPMS